MNKNNHQMKLVEPTIEMRAALLQYQAEFLSIGSDMIAGSSQLQDFSEIQDWLGKLADNRNPSSESGRVPSLEYVLISSAEKIIGMVNVRLELNEQLVQRGGHIGYSIAPSERQNGYGSLLLDLTLEKMKDFGFDRVLITCDESNLASAKIIENNGGKLENKVFNKESQKWVCRYWIKL